MKNIILVLLTGIVYNCYSQSPNVLFVIADDLGTDVSNGYFNNPLMPVTPTLDSLRANGVTFANVWATPVCTPTRASIMSGQYGVKTGVLRAPGNLDTTYSSLFKRQQNNSYTGAVVGKWHISNPVNTSHPAQHGIDYYMGLMEGFPADYYAWNKTYNGNTTVSSSYITTDLTDSAIGWINKQPSKWVMWLAHTAPHAPFHTPPSFMYAVNNATTNYRKFIAMIESIDYDLKRLLLSLDSATRANTVVIFIGDNGTTNQVLQHYPAGRGKSSLYQGGIRVPMIVSGKGVTRMGETDTSLINVLDIHATILELTGATLPGGIDNSLSFKHLLSNTTTGATRDYDYSEISDPSDVEGYTIRNHTYKLIKFDDGGEEFYNLKTDSFELNNLLLGTLSSTEQVNKLDLEQEANSIRTGWSCRDYIQNGDEIGIDCGGSLCNPCVTGISNEKLLNTIAIYPNPVNNILYLKKRTETPSDIYIYNLSGVLVAQKINTLHNYINVDNISPGLYVIKINSNEYQSIHQLVIN